MRRKAVQSCLLVLVTAIFLHRYCQVLNGQEKRETSASQRSDESVRFPITSISQLQSEQYLKGFPSVPVELDVHLTFAAKTWTTFFVQQGSSAMMVACDPAVSAELSDLNVGAQLRIRGMSRQGSYEVDLSSYEILDSQSSTTSIDANDLSENGHVPMNGVARMSGRIHEVLIRPDHTVAYTKIGYLPVELEVYEPLSREEAIAYWSRYITAEGCLVRDAPIADTIFLLRLMRRNQIQFEFPPAINEDNVAMSDLVCHVGQVLFSDSKNKVIVDVNNTLRVVNTVFARRLLPGNKLSIYSQRFRQSNREEAPLTSCVIVDQGKDKLPTGQAYTISSLRNVTTKPVRVTIAAKVIHTQYLESGCLLDLECGFSRFKALLPSSTAPMSATGFRIDDEILVSGAPITSVNQNNRADWQTGDIVLHLASDSDIRLLTAPVRLSSNLIMYACGSIGLLISLGIVWNTLLRRRVNQRTEKLNEMSIHLRKSYEAIREAVLVVDRYGKVSGVNSRFKRLFKIAPSEGDNASLTLREISRQACDEKSFAAFLKSSESNITEPVATRFKFFQSERTMNVFSSAIVDPGGSSYGRLWAFEDVTDQLLLENNLLQAQKMEAVGQLSGGIAHDFNNLLTVIRSSLTMIDLSIRAKKSYSEFVDAAEIAIDRATELTQHLLDFSRRSNLCTKVIDANEIVKQVLTLVRRTIDVTIKIEVDLSDEPVFINVDVTRVEQALINICINARDALNDSQHAKTIVMRTILTKHSILGPSVLISVRDNGCGMSNDVQSRVFEPFFTTKAPGSGTGLGLSMVFGVIEQLGGKISFETALGEGTQFNIYFPVAVPDLQEQPILDLDFAVTPERMRLLLVDDEKLIRDSGKAVLEALGHEVETAGNGKEAIEKISAHPEFDAVLLDLTMPEMSGADAYREIQRRWPELPIAICSGYSVDIPKLFGLTTKTPLIISKPYRIDMLRLQLPLLRDSWRDLCRDSCM